jgi:uncharacterized protein YbjT (DUF2867 family)
MRIVVAGGTGLIGSSVVESLRERGHEAVAASPSTGVDTITGAGLTAALRGADAVVDVTNKMVFEPEAITDFFTTSTRNLLAAEREAGVRHHVLLSIVGVDRLSHPGYLAAKAAQETLVAESGIPFTIVRATQFYEFLPTITAGFVQGDVIVPPTADLQPIAAADVAATLVDVVTSAPAEAAIDLAGPERAPFAHFLTALGDPRPVKPDTAVGYFGVPIVQDSLVPQGEARIGQTTFETWTATRPTH